MVPSLWLWAATVDRAQWRTSLLACTGVLGTLVATSPAIAQIVPDATLPIPTMVESVESLDAGQTLEIEGGSLAGPNLFHSFREFSIPAEVTAELLAPAGVTELETLSNIFLRVTDDLPSQIDGQLRGPGRADVFLLNPNGI